MHGRRSHDRSFVRDRRDGAAAGEAERVELQEARARTIDDPQTTAERIDLHHRLVRVERALDAARQLLRRARSVDAHLDEHRRLAKVERLAHEEQRVERAIPEQQRAVITTAAIVTADQRPLSIAQEPELRADHAIDAVRGRDRLADAVPRTVRQRREPPRRVERVRVVAIVAARDHEAALALVEHEARAVRVVAGDAQIRLRDRIERPTALAFPDAAVGEERVDHAVAIERELRVAIIEQHTIVDPERRVPHLRGVPVDAIDPEVRVTDEIEPILRDHRRPEPPERHGQRAFDPFHSTGLTGRTVRRERQGAK
jgi:hypothetical protein